MHALLYAHKIFLFIQQPSSYTHIPLLPIWLIIEPLLLIQMYIGTRTRHAKGSDHHDDLIYEHFSICDLDFFIHTFLSIILA